MSDGVPKYADDLSKTYGQLECLWYRACNDQKIGEEERAIIKAAISDVKASIIAAIRFILRQSQDEVHDSNRHNGDTAGL